MGLIINPRGIGGSGKTELVRRVMHEYGWSGDSSANSSGEVIPIFAPGRRYPFGYRLLHPLDHRPLIVFGHYERKSGGCDTIRQSDGGLAEIFRLAAERVESGHDVLLEGLHLSREVGGSVRLAQRHPLHVIHLDTPPPDSARNLIRRRRAGTDQLPLMIGRGVAEREEIAAACERLRPHAEIHRLGFDAALSRTRELLRLTSTDGERRERPNAPVADRRVWHAFSFRSNIADGPR